jgi:hypothetical protein
MFLNPVAPYKSLAAYKAAKSRFYSRLRKTQKEFGLDPVAAYYKLFREGIYHPNIKIDRHTDSVVERVLKCI